MKGNKKDFIAEWLFFLVFIGLSVAGLYRTLPEGVLEKMGVHRPDTIVELSGFTAALMYSALGILTLRFAVKYVFPLLKLREFFAAHVGIHIKVKIAQAIILALAFIIGSAIAKAQPPHLKLAQSFVGITEQPPGSNSGKEVNVFLAYVGLKPGYSWCAAFVSYCLGKSSVASPQIKSASARAFITKQSIRAFDVLTGKATVPDGAVAIWQRGNGWQGHTGFVEKQIKQNQFWIIEGNTSNGLKGSQYNGNVCARRLRSICLTDHFRLIAFTPVTYRL